MGEGVGITCYSAYVPAYRLEGTTVGQAWGSRRAPARRAVANHDEDSLTMAAEAALNCLSGVSGDVDGMYFASTTSPYIEKQAASLLAYLGNLPATTMTAEFSGSTRAGTAAVMAAVDAITAGSAQQVLVAAADQRPTEPGGETELSQGDGAAALCLGKDGIIARITARVSLTNEIMDTWRTAADKRQRKSEPGFADKFGVQKFVPEAIAAVLAKAGLGEADIKHVALAAPDARNYASLTKALKFDPAVYDNPPLIAAMGSTGNALPLQMIIAALEKAEPGDRILACGYSNGVVDALILEVTERINTVRQRQRGVAYYLARGRNMTSYAKFLQYTGALERENFKPGMSFPMLWRESRQNLQLVGVRCQNCNTLAFPRRRVCRQCGAKDNFADYTLAKKGTLFSFEINHVFPSDDPPMGMALVDLEGGGRFYGQMADFDAAAIEIGMPVELTIRKLHEGGNVPNYFWKVRPVGQVQP